MYFYKMTMHLVHLQAASVKFTIVRECECVPKVSLRKLHDFLQIFCVQRNKIAIERIQFINIITIRQLFMCDTNEITSTIN